MHPIHIGTCGWSYPDWGGVFYPKGLASGEYLSHYAAHYPVVEVDSTFYRTPSLSMVRLSHDHMGSFGTALANINTPEAQQADDDLSVGKLVETVANSPYAKDTLIVVTEDDVQDGPDHVD